MKLYKCISLTDFKIYGIKKNPFIIKTLKTMNEINWSINEKFLETNHIILDSINPFEFVHTI